MLGNITEKQPSKKVAPLIVGNNGGFPPIIRSTSLTSKRSSDNAHIGGEGSEITNNGIGVVTIPVGMALQSQKLTSNAQQAPPANEFSEMNESMIEAMSPEEINLAIDEIRLLLTPKSIQFLQKGPVPTETVQARHKPRQINDDAALNLVPKAPLVPTSENPWFGVESVASVSVRPIIEVESPTVDRYDLNGRKITELLMATEKIKEEVLKSGLFNSNKTLPDDVGGVVSALCVQCMKPMAKSGATVEGGGGDGYFLWRDDALASAHQQPQDELKHHQYQNESPGYSLREIIEMFRSEFANQRIVAMRMLSGILLRRECAVALEAYSEAFSANCSAWSSQQLQRIEDEVGRESALFANLSQCFEDLVIQVKSRLCASDSGGIVLAESSVSSTALAPLSQEHNRQLRKLLCWSAMHLLCAPDLPVELPTLLLWALSSNINSAYSVSPGGDLSDLQLAPSFGLAAPRNNPAVAKLGLLRCLHMYLRSPAEEACVDWLRARSILWSAYGTPRLCTPHTRRSGRSYEQDMSECLERSSKFLDEEDEEQQDEEERQAKQRTPDSVAEAFALQCRWSRVSAIVSRGTLVALLASHAVVAVENLLDILSAAKNSFSPSGDVVTALGLSSLRLLAVIVRQGGDDVLPILHKQFLRPSWRIFVALCECDHIESANSALTEVLCLWWNVLAELVLRDRSAAAFLFETHAEWTGSVVLRLLLRKSSEINRDDGGAERVGSIVARVLRCSLSYGLGFACVTEMLMAEQVLGLDSVDRAAGQTPHLSIDVLVLLEQAAVSAGAIFGLKDRNTPHSTQPNPFDSARVISEAVQVSNSIFSFIKRNWHDLQMLVLEGSPCQSQSTAILSLFSAVFSRAQDEILAVPSSSYLHTDFVSLCRLRMAESIISSGGLRGRGLIFSAISFNAQLLAAAQMKVGGSVTAAVLHLCGQGRDLARFASEQDIFRVDVVNRWVAAHGTVKGELKRGSVAWLQAREFDLSLLRHINIVAELNANKGKDLGELITFHATNSSSCCQKLEVTRSGDEKMAGGGVAEGILMWHFQRIQQGCLVLQMTGTAALLARLPHSEKLGENVDFLLATHLPSVSANSHSSILIGLSQAYLRRLIFACHADPTVDLLELYGQAELKYAPLLSSLTRKAFGLDVSKYEVVADGGIDGAAVYRSAGEWMKLHGPVNTAIALKANWAYEALLGDLSGDQLADWLQVLLTHSARTLQETSDALLASQIYILLKLTASDQAFKWAQGVQAESNGDTLFEINQRAVEGYRALLMLLLVRTKHFPSFTTTFCRVVSSEYFATTGMMSAHRNKLRAAKNGLSKYVNLEGVLDLCEKALDAGLNQAIDEQVHSIVLVALSGPLMPWAVRQRVWTQLSALRLVHLLEDRCGLLTLLPVLLPPLHTTDSRALFDLRGPVSTESLSFYLEVVDGLSNLRSPADRSWTIVAVSIAQLTHFVFAETKAIRGLSAGNTITGQRAQLLLHLTAQQNADWIFRAILLHASGVFERSHASDLVGVVQELTSYCVSVDRSVDTVNNHLSFFRDLEVEMVGGAMQSFSEMTSRAVF